MNPSSFISLPGCCSAFTTALSVRGTGSFWAMAFMLASDSSDESHRPHQGHEFASNLTSLAFFSWPARCIYSAGSGHGRRAAPGCPRRLAHGRPSTAQNSSAPSSHHGLRPHAENCFTMRAEILTAKKTPALPARIVQRHPHPRLEIPPPALHRRPSNPLQLRRDDVQQPSRLLHRAGLLSVSHKLSTHPPTQFFRRKWPGIAPTVVPVA